MQVTPVQKNVDRDISIINYYLVKEIEKVTAQAVRDAGAAFNVYQHGSLGIMRIQARWITECELIPGSNYFLWGSGVKEDFQEAADRAGVSLLVTGSLELRDIARRAGMP